MERLVFLGSLALILSLPASGGSSPLKGKHAAKEKISEQSALPLEMEFKGGERACVIVRGDHRPVVDLRVTVYDAQGKVVAKDDRGGDIVTVIWYPPRDAVYRIEIVNPGEAYNVCYVSFK